LEIRTISWEVVVVSSKHKKGNKNPQTSTLGVRSILGHPMALELGLLFNGYLARAQCPFGWGKAESWVSPDFLR